MSLVIRLLCICLAFFRKAGDIPAPTLGTLLIQALQHNHPKRAVPATQIKTIAKMKKFDLGGQTHTWTGFFHRFQSAAVETGTNPCLVIHYFQLGHGGGDILVHVPIPAGREQEAGQAVQELENAFA